MKSIGVSNDLPDYLKSQFSVTNPSKRVSTAHKSYKTPLRQGVSTESPKHFHIKHVPVLNNSEKNKNISQDSNNPRFSSSLKKNIRCIKPHFDYSEIKGQKFDYDSLKFVEGLDVKAGHSARLSRLMGYNEMYSKTLSEGFGKARGDFIVELSQPSVHRFEGREISRLKKYVEKKAKKLEELRKGKNFEEFKKIKDYSLNFCSSRMVNTPNSKLRKRKVGKSESVSLAELDFFEADIKTKQSLWNSTAIYKDY